MALEALLDALGEAVRDDLLARVEKEGRDDFVSAVFETMRQDRVSAEDALAKVRQMGEDGLADPSMKYGNAITGEPGMTDAEFEQFARICRRMMDDGTARFREAFRRMQAVVAIDQEARLLAGRN